MGESRVYELKLLHLCCSGGYNELKDYQKRYPLDTRKVKVFNLFQCRDLKYPEKYGFELEDLRKHSFLCDENSIIEKW